MKNWLAAFMILLSLTTRADEIQLSEDLSVVVVSSSRLSQEVRDAIAAYHARILESLAAAKTYPPVARRLNQEGNVMLRLLADEGTVTVSIIESETNAPFGLCSAAENAIWRAIKENPLPDSLRHEYFFGKYPVKFKLL